MNNNISIFKNAQFGEVRVIDQNGEPWFNRKDVCVALSIQNPNDATASLDDDEKGVVITDTPGGPQEMTVISEAGLYSLILRSSKPEAKAFKRWVTHEVLPAIRKTGGYIPVKPGDSDMDVLARGFLIATKQLETLKAQIASDAPKVATYDASLSEADDEIAMAVLANRLSQEGLPFGLQRLYAYLRQQGVLCSVGSRKNLPTQRYMDKGWFRVIAPPPYAGDNWKPTLRVTPKGVAEITTRVHELFNSGSLSQ